MQSIKVSFKQEQKDKVSSVESNLYVPWCRKDNEKLKVLIVNNDKLTCFTYRIFRFLAKNWKWQNGKLHVMCSTSYPLSLHWAFLFSLLSCEKNTLILPWCSWSSEIIHDFTIPIYKTTCSASHFPPFFLIVPYLMERLINSLG